ncbi:MAG: cobalt-precorrin-5B (C(1))-methyltransferase, partial [Clostridia bacterium]|nr:cobalt-precorrin-5B (C(1))-methyltransferase [Clostridia bacterium]
MLEEYICRGKQRLRCGYTTGSCAAAAAKAACEMLITGEIVGRVELMTPKGILLNLDVLDIEINSEY